MPGFNEALLHFLSKKVGGHLPEGTPWVDVDAVRPLSVTNADNRILANTIRKYIEPLVAPGITDVQRGFLRFRSVLGNVIDIDEAMMLTALDEEEGAAIFLTLRLLSPRWSKRLCTNYSKRSTGPIGCATL